ncbi:DUF3644 domain-containing protein [Staphylococcus xylosus]|uniref:DUF3644 domain-containing protein n=1 Tax=Staphylococcus xylosus TaxID=1288 RepID=UPI002DBBDE3F|nr:DUF3644 domain-containing protein [Staphylococcus xylosus]MEB8101016.1 DUF3644 domain-containing protein [Staphylococcus xylosus]
MENLSKQLVDKSIESFILGLEIYNKPTIKYRIEGFSFFICNAWELMLKAELLNRGENIYYEDNPDRTISLSIAIKLIYPDYNTRIRLNLEKIVDLRNISTHFITQEYEIKYAPLFQACVMNFINETIKFHNKDVSEYISQNFLTISASYDPLSNEQIKVKYPAEIAEKFIRESNDIDVLSKEYSSDKFSIDIKQNLYITKKKEDADFLVAMHKNSENKVDLIKEYKDPSDTHKYSYSNVITAVNERLKKGSITIDYSKGFNQYVLNLVIDFCNIKSEEKFSYKHTIGKQESYTYSQQFIEFIVNEIKKNPDKFVESLKK